MTLQIDITSPFRGHGERRPASAAATEDDVAYLHSELNQSSIDLVKEIETYLRDNIEDRAYLKSRDIADALDRKVRAIAAVMRFVGHDDPNLTLQKWSKTNATTWLVEIES